LDGGGIGRRPTRGAVDDDNDSRESRRRPAHERARRRGDARCRRRWTLEYEYEYEYEFYRRDEQYELAVARWGKAHVDDAIVVGIIFIVVLQRDEWLRHDGGRRTTRLDVSTTSCSCFSVVVFFCFFFISFFFCFFFGDVAFIRC
jgi:hypothetical protein